MTQRRDSAIIISPYRHLREVFDRREIGHVISILGRSDNLDWPSVGTRKILRLEFDDTIYSSGNFVAPNREQIADLIEFAKGWNGDGALLAHCRAGSSRSPAAAIIAAATLGRRDTRALVMQVRTAKAYFRPNETMLKLADELLGNGSELVDLARCVAMPNRTDEWGPTKILLPSITAS